MDAHDLRVLGVGVLDFRVAFQDLPPDPSFVQKRLAGEAAHPPHQIRQVVGDDEIGAVLLERLDRGSCATAQAGPEQQPEVPVGDVRVLFRSGEGELFFDDLLGEDEPGVAVLLDVRGGAQQFQGAQGVVAGQPWRGEPAAQGVEPQGRRPGQDPNDGAESAAAGGKAG
jgi:hypothetical protein